MTRLLILICRGVHAPLAKISLALMSLIAQNNRAAYKAAVADILDLLEGNLTCILLIRLAKKRHLKSGKPPLSGLQAAQC